MIEQLGKVVGGLIIVFVVLWLIGTFYGPGIVVLFIMAFLFFIMPCIVGYRCEKRLTKQLAESAELAELAEDEKRLEVVVSEISKNTSHLLALIQHANRDLDKAEGEFKANAYAPFWDCIMSATEVLAKYHRTVENIKKNILGYERIAERSPSIVDKLAMHRVGHLLQNLDANPAATRLAEIWRKGQTNFEFASIYQNYKTNKILVWGFSQLGSALESIEDKISNSYDELCEINYRVGEQVAQNEEQVNLLREQTDLLRE